MSVLNRDSNLLTELDEEEEDDVLSLEPDGRMQRVLGLGLEHGVEQRRRHVLEVSRRKVALKRCHTLCQVVMGLSCLAPGFNLLIDSQ